MGGASPFPRVLQVSHPLGLIHPPPTCARPPTPASLRATAMCCGSGRRCPTLSSTMAAWASTRTGLMRRWSCTATSRSWAHSCTRRTFGPRSTCKRWGQLSYQQAGLMMAGGGRGGRLGLDSWILGSPSRVSPPCSCPWAAAFLDSSPALGQPGGEGSSLRSSPHTGGHHGAAEEDLSHAVGALQIQARVCGHRRHRGLGTRDRLGLGVKPGNPVIPLPSSGNLLLGTPPFGLLELRPQEPCPLPVPPLSP